MPAGQARGIVRLGIIGARGQGGFYAGLVEQGRIPHLRLAALCGREATARYAHETFPHVPFHGSVEALLDSGDVDAVVTTVPHYLHTEVAQAAIERGIHVLVEKPLGVYTRQVERLLRTAADHPDVVVGALFNMRANPLWSRLKRAIEDGEIGRLRRTTWVITTWFRPQRYYDQDAWRGTWGGEGGGVLVNQAAHQVDLWQWLCGAPRSVYAKVAFGLAHDIDVEDDVTAVLDHGRQGTGVLITATHDMMGIDRLEILGEQGKILVEDSRRATITRLHRPMDAYATAMDDETIGRVIRGTIDWGAFSTTEVIEDTDARGAQHAAVLENFARAILFGDPLLTPVAEGMDAVRLSNAILLSGWLGREVPFDFDEDLFLDQLNARIRAEGQFPERS